MSRLDKLAILDRDGVLLRAFAEGDITRGPRYRAEFEVLPEAVEACELLEREGYILAVATNQPDIARKKIGVTESFVLQWMTQAAFGIEHYACCPHDTGDNCSCRKPEPGLLYRLAVETDTSLRQAIMFGDRETDAVAAYKAGVAHFCGMETNGSLLDAVKGVLQWIGPQGKSLE
jgi:D-glycero-D-manno-heptose 1,7-bisphosphate phosphatase